MWFYHYFSKRRLCGFLLCFGKGVVGRGRGELKIEQGGGVRRGLKFSATGHSQVAALFANEEQKKGWFVTFCTLPPHMPTLFMTFQTQDGKHKMAVLRAMFSQLSNINSNKMP